MTRLIITNGDTAGELLAAAGVDADILPWRDVLHEGPIVGGGLDHSTAVRSAFLAGRFGMEPGEIAAEFAERDAVLRNHAAYETVELWFEHDLYDQLQLLQVLSFFADAGRSEGLRLVQADDYLGAQTPETILRFAERARSLDEDALDFADMLWADLAMPTPEAVVRRIEEPDEALPFAAPAMHRFLDELPAPDNGLGRTEAAALSRLTEATQSAIDLFRRTTAAEDAAFMGDLSFFLMLHDLADCPAPLIAGLAPLEDEDAERYARPLSLTAAGRAVLAAEDDHVRLNGIDRWWAGTRLKGRTTWRYDRKLMTLVSPQASAA
ncbi:MAG: hypothetical protein J0H08_04120 [Rhizobiales bacterium]|nr:hypothetical protein [Hyphomicrobiales bacterium]